MPNCTTYHKGSVNVFTHPLLFLMLAPPAASCHECRFICCCWCDLNSAKLCLLVCWSYKFHQPNYNVFSFLQQKICGLKCDLYSSTILSCTAHLSLTYEWLIAFVFSFELNSVTWLAWSQATTCTSVEVAAWFSFTCQNSFWYRFFINSSYHQI